MATTSQVRIWWADHWAAGYTGRMRWLGREGVKYHVDTLSAWLALEDAFALNGYGDAVIVSTYYPRAISGYECDMQNGGSGCSTHGYSGCAIDVDPGLNPYKKGVPFSWADTKFTPEQVAAGKAIRTTSGKSVWRWLGDSMGNYNHDYMHWQIDCSQEDLATGIDPATVPSEEDMSEFSNPAFEPAFNEMVAAGIYSQHTQPQDNITAEKLAVFLKRAKDQGYYLVVGPAGPKGDKGDMGPAGDDGRTPIIEVTYE